ncbi:MAG: methionine synthase, partial [Treponema sp.]|nr:methionine synthase [Treponema sp.]
MNIRKQLDDTARRRILILDGAMGSMIQKYKLSEGDYRGGEFADHPVSLLGCNDLLCLTAPDLISSIHGAYLEAGADIITTCSFNATSLSLGDYELGSLAYRISRTAAELARKQADRYSTPETKRYVAGSIGPTGKSASISPDLKDPGKRGTGWDELEAAYYDNVRGLLDGGADLLLMETIFDTLNAKAALFAIGRILEERRIDAPVMISGSISDAAGRLLAGQTVEAFALSVLHGRPWSLGLNCSLGAEKLLPHIRALSALAPVWVSAYPNAGLPNRFGEYDESPGTMAGFLKPFLEEGLVNILGGCCGTTPDHIRAVADLASGYRPRKPRTLPEGKTFLTGLEPLEISREAGVVDIGERANVAGSRKFLKLIRKGAWEEALDLTREMIDQGARIIDICMDDPLLDSGEAMIHFLNLALSDPEISRLPMMPDSSRWETLEEALKCIQGKSLVNSISLKEGEKEFLRRAGLIRRYGAAAVVMLFDETGQAVRYEHKIAVAERSYRLLASSGFPPGDIVFDPNVLTIATGIPEHDDYALDFIRACGWISEHCPGAKISGGIANLSFSFRGNDRARAALHRVFLKHAAGAGLSMAIVNPADLRSPEEPEGELREAAENLILNKKTANPAEAFLALVLKTREGENAPSGDSAASWRSLPPEERVIHALVKGIDTYIEEDVGELRGRFRRAMEILEGPLLKGMGEVGRRFGEGAMFLPQVIRSARVMKKAAAVLEPFMAAEKQEGAGAVKVVLATVKGDVHDIGKNIVAVVLGCNGYEVLNLGVMVPAEKILETARNEGVAFIGLSGLISPSLEEMIRVAEEMEKQGFKIPLLIGGAAASAAYTGLRIAPVYSGPVVYVRDAGQSPLVLGALLSPNERFRFLEKLEEEYEEARRLHARTQENRVILPLEEARANRVAIDWRAEGSGPAPAPKARGLVKFDDYPVEKLLPYIDWIALYSAFDLGRGPEAEDERRRLRADAEALLWRIAAEKLLTLRGRAAFYPALSEGEDILLFAPDLSGRETARFSFLRNQTKKIAGGRNPCLSDFILPREARGENPGGDWMGFFAVSAGFGLD